MVIDAKYKLHVSNIHIRSLIIEDMDPKFSSTHISKVTYTYFILMEEF